MGVSNQYTIEFYHDPAFSPSVADRLADYELKYFDESEYMFPTVIGVRVFEDGRLLKSAGIGSIDATQQLKTLLKLLNLTGL